MTNQEEQVKAKEQELTKLKDSLTKTETDLAALEKQLQEVGYDLSLFVFGCSFILMMVENSESAFAE